MARFKPKRCLLTTAIIASFLFLFRTFVMVQQVSTDNRNIGHINGHSQRGDIKINSGETEGQIDDGSPPKAVLLQSLGNYEVTKVKPVNGPGEGGDKVKTNNIEKDMVNKLINEYGFNQYVSDKISLDRNIPDLRSQECKYWHYPSKLPSTSVIIVFHNEGWSTLLRTVHSVFNRSPARLLKEVVLVDDFSTKDHLKQRLEDYTQEPRFDGKLKLVRNQKREGLIRTRIIGAKEASGEVLIWLDAHCEVGTNWLPPLLAPIAANRTTVVCPIVDVIDNMDFHVYPQGTGDADRGGFDWSLFWKHFRMPDFERMRRQHDTEPYRSPAMAGGLFAMDRKFFFELGAYDEGLEIWGGENFELSFKIWMCGGSLLWVPCSRVGHVYRILGKVPYSAPNSSMVVLSERNLRRVVEVWFDEYKEYFYRSKPEALLVSTGNIEKQLAFRKTHNCRSFKWFMTEIAPDIIVKYPLPSANAKWGEVRVKDKILCVDSMGAKDGGKISMSYCHGAGGNQLFRLTVDGQFRIHDQCVFDSGKILKVRRCDTRKYSWQYDEETSAIFLKERQLCVEYSDREVHLAKCEDGKRSQMFEITSEKLRRFH